ncbi:hypothetical protein BCF33_2694 [Hasllibacter halocynthiae]|uniref:Uncharacterized protein n=1 Tax=Hasllibacter halocynthiae TaxID=595589 RepID=A0A2T0X4E2_9RHOB|nr:hypothetical protein [Hasllibacter halocynthiae]PRY93809.1 hypothetical protein BCF33_2694 [Hasllibacter halocynthiae]
MRQHGEARGLPPEDQEPCVVVLLDILFEGRAPSENRIEALLDRALRAERKPAWAR